MPKNDIYIFTEKICMKQDKSGISNLEHQLDNS